MKIAAISTSRIPSNTANSIQVMKVCQALQQKKQEVKLWIPNFKTADWKELADHYGLSSPFEIEWLPFRKNLKQYDFSWRSVQAGIRWKADVIYTWALQAAALSAMKKRLTVMEFHDYPMGSLGPFWFRLFMRAPGRKIVLTTTQGLADGLQERYKIRIPENILQIAPNGTDLERYQSLPDSRKARQELGMEERFTILYSGHFYPGRGMNLMVGLAQALPQFEFLWIGGQEKDIELWKMRLKEDGIKNVVLTGFIPNARLPLYQAAGDILLMPYQREIAGSSGGNIVKVINPMKMFDYLASRRVILASDIPIFHEILNEQNCVFCPPEDLHAWTNAILDLAADRQEREKLAARAFKDAARFTWAKRAEQTLTKIEALSRINYERNI
jgi:glycosyltransferase involved in cell wall biosynthesis